MQRIQVIGSAGAGKTTFARQLAARLDLPHLELDALFWRPGWTEPDRGEFSRQMQARLEQGPWVTDGNYRFLRPVIWPLADTIIFLDFPLRISFPRLLRRTWRRVSGRQVLWAGNRETVRDVLFSRDSILWYTLSTFQRRRANNWASIRDPDHAHLDFIVFDQPQAADAWLDQLSRGQSAQ